MFLQKILHDIIVGLRLLAVLFIAAGLALSGCEESDDSSSSGGSLSFTDGDGIAETTDAPSFSPSTVTAGSDVTVTVSVDSDTTHVVIHLGVYDPDLFVTSTTSAVTSVSASSTTAIAVTVPGGATAGDWATRIDTCDDGACTLGTSVGRILVPFTDYQIMDLSTGSFLSSTGVTPDTFAVQ